MSKKKNFKVGDRLVKIKKTSTGQTHWDAFDVGETCKVISVQNNGYEVKGLQEPYYGQIIHDDFYELEKIAKTKLFKVLK
jgi:hypothetical protein